LHRWPAGSALFCPCFAGADPVALPPQKPVCRACLIAECCVFLSQSVFSDAPVERCSPQPADSFLRILGRVHGTAGWFGLASLFSSAPWSRSGCVWRAPAGEGAAESSKGAWNACPAEAMRGRGACQASPAPARPSQAVVGVHLCCCRALQVVSGAPRPISGNPSTSDSTLNQYFDSKLGLVDSASSTHGRHLTGVCLSCTGPAPAPREPACRACIAAPPRTTNPPSAFPTNTSSQPVSAVVDSQACNKCKTPSCAVRCRCSCPAAMAPCDETSDQMEPMDLAALNRCAAAGHRAGSAQQQTVLCA
jgi:hypothetical protein